MYGVLFTLLICNLVHYFWLIVQNSQCQTLIFFKTLIEDLLYHVFLVTSPIILIYPLITNNWHIHMKQMKNPLGTNNYPPHTMTIILIYQFIINNWHIRTHHANQANNFSHTLLEQSICELLKIQVLYIDQYESFVLFIFDLLGLKIGFLGFALNS